MALLFGGFYLLTRILGSHGPAVAEKLPFGAAEQAYAERIHFNDLHMSRSTNMIKQEFTYVLESCRTTACRRFAECKLPWNFATVSTR
jgi:hypothetical protein